MTDPTPQPSEDRAAEQQNTDSWPKPGDEGYVHPDGTPESVRQLAANRQAQADRDRIGSVVHGAPLATPGPQAAEITGEKVRAAAGEDTSTPAKKTAAKKAAPKKAAAASTPAPTSSESGQS